VAKLTKAQRAETEALKRVVRMPPMTGRTTTYRLAASSKTQVVVAKPPFLDKPFLDDLSLLLGPFTATVLIALQNVGMMVDLDRLTAAANRLLETPETPVGKPQERLELLWTLLASVGHLLEEGAALVLAIEEWIDDGRPLGDACRIGESFSRSVLNGGELTEIFKRYATEPAVRTLLGYPSRRQIMEYVDRDTARVLTALCTRSARQGAELFRTMAEIADQDIWRTYIRSKHRVSATSPALAPIWLAEPQGDSLNPDDRVMLGIIDWPSKKGGEPSLIVWRVANNDVSDYLGMAGSLNWLVRCIVQSVLKVADVEMRPLQLILPAGKYLTDSENKALMALGQTQYLRDLRTRWRESRSTASLPAKRPPE
jgi:hypothetical protein